MHARCPRWPAGLLLALAAACRHVPTEKELQGAQIHYDLGVHAQSSNDVQGALAEFEQALATDPNFAEAHNAIAILLHVAFKRPEEAVPHYKRALEIRPTFSEAKTNLANVYLDLGRYDEAIALYQEALNDMLYPTPFIAEGNLGWALYKKGDARAAVDHIKAAVTTNPKFCLGYKNLGIIQDEGGNTEDACRQFGNYAQTCPDLADAHYRAGVCLAKLGKGEDAKKSFEACQAKSGNPAVKDDCRRLAEHLK